MPFIKVKKTAVVALSGGVDSSTVAAILKELGFRVIGVYYKRGGKYIKDLIPEFKCSYKQDIEFVEKTAKHLGIQFEVLDLSKEYKTQVLDTFVKEYKKGNTPNPDVLCNRFIKFGKLLEYSQKYNFDIFATGHYARVSRKNPLFSWELFSNDNSQFFSDDLQLKGAIDPGKDQVYFLSSVKREMLHKVTFPLGNLYKSEVRLLAKYFNLPTFKRKESQGICFLGNISVQKFLQKALGAKKGDIVDIETGQKVGEHSGVYLYTIGQRKGLNIGGLDKPYFVVNIDSKNNIVYVAKGRDNAYLNKESITVQDFNWLVDSRLDKSGNKKLGKDVSINKKGLLHASKLLQSLSASGSFWALARYRQNPVPVGVSIQNVSEKNSNTQANKGVNGVSNTSTLKIKALFGTKFWAPAKGQYGVLLYSKHKVNANDFKEVASKTFGSREDYKDINKILLQVFGNNKIKNNLEKTQNKVDIADIIRKDSLYRTYTVIGGGKIIETE